MSQRKPAVEDFEAIRNRLKELLQEADKAKPKDPDEEGKPATPIPGPAPSKPADAPPPDYPYEDWGY